MSSSRLLVSLAASASIALLAFPAAAATFTTLHVFPDRRLGAGANDLLYQNGFLVGVTDDGGTSGGGSLFKLKLATNSTNVLYDFATKASGGFTVDGQFPLFAPTTRGADLIGVTTYGGSTGELGTLYEFDVGTRTEEKLHVFSGTPDGSYPSSRVLVIDGVFYGTTQRGGTNGVGSIFKFDPATNSESIIFSFTGQAGLGSYPFGRLIYQNGYLYGAAGIVYKLNLATNAFTVLHTFEAHNGAIDLTLHDHTLYGVTHGGKFGYGGIFSLNLTTGFEKPLYSFHGGEDGQDALETPIFLNGVLFGTTSGGGTAGYGTIYSLDLESGVKTTVHNFNKVPDGSYPTSLIEHNGVLYGATNDGGNDNCQRFGCGTVFSFVP